MVTLSERTQPTHFINDLSNHLGGDAMSTATINGMTFNLAEAKSRAAYWNAILADQFKGRTIIEARYMTAEESEEYGWDESAAVFFFDNGSHCIVSQDDEGNGAGALLTSNETNPIIPVV